LRQRLITDKTPAATTQDQTLATNKKKTHDKHQKRTSVVGVHGGNVCPLVHHALQHNHHGFGVRFQIHPTVFQVRGMSNASTNGGNGP
jgi:hypothetical protein